MTDAAALSPAKDEIRQAEIYLQRACKRLRKAGWDDTADELGRLARGVHVFTRPGGLLEILEKAEPWPEEESVE